jgi:hypothetical protein
VSDISEQGKLWAEAVMANRPPAIEIAALRVKLADADRMIAHLRFRLDEVAASRHRQAEAQYKAVRQLDDIADYLIRAMGYQR